LRIELATGGKTVHLPYAFIADKQSNFIDKKYLPKKFVFRDARNLNKAVIENLLNHLIQRQEHHGAADSFRFKSIKSGKDIVASKYPDADTYINRKGKRRRANKSRGEADPDPDTNAVDNESVPQTTGNALHQPSIRIHPDANMDAITNSIPEHETTRSPFTIIDEEQIQKLYLSGLPSHSPINGPADGPPQYAVDTGRLNTV
jgi:hypothetical protein